MPIIVEFPPDYIILTLSPVAAFPLSTFYHLALHNFLPVFISHTKIELLVIFISV